MKKTRVILKLPQFSPETVFNLRDTKKSLGFVHTGLFTIALAMPTMWVEHPFLAMPAMARSLL